MRVPVSRDLTRVDGALRPRLGRSCAQLTARPSIPLPNSLDRLISESLVWAAWSSRAYGPRIRRCPRLLTPSIHRKGPDPGCCEAGPVVVALVHTPVHGVTFAAAFIGNARRGIDCGGLGLERTPIQFDPEITRSDPAVGEVNRGVVLSVGDPGSDGAAASGSAKGRHASDWGHAAQHVAAETAERVGHHRAKAVSSAEHAGSIDAVLFGDID